MTAQTILPANTLSSGGYDVDNGIRFDGSSSYMTMTPSSAGSQKIVTFSTWIKRSQIGEGGGPADVFMMYGYAGSNSDTRLYFTGDGNANDDRLYFQSTTSNTTHTALATNRKFRDPNAWYHIVINYNSSVSSPDTNHVEMFINGVKETSFATETYPSQNDLVYWTDDSLHTIGRRSDGGNLWYGGYMAETVMIDGQALDADSFGEFDDSGVWKPIDVSDLTFGTNGFYLQYQGTGTSADSSGLGADTSGNDHHFAISGLAAIDQTTDTCTNNFATMNILANKVTAATFTEGNLVTSFANGRGACTSNHGLTTGKWYVEMGFLTMPKDERFGLGIAPFETKAEDLSHDVNNQGLGLSGYNAVIYANTDSGSGVIDNFFGNNTTRFDSFTGLIGMALDLTSATKTIAFSKAGAWVTGGGTSDTDFSNALKVDISASFARHQFWHIACGTGNGDGTNGILSMNFGSPAFAISSGNADGNGFGNFEYAVPSGYLALCTKNLAENG